MVMVILVHSRTRYPGLSSTFDIFKFGQMGCQLFFVLSGYSICLSWSKGLNIKRFYAKRYISIAPGYYLMIVIMAVLTLMSELIIHRKIGFGGNTDPLAILSNFLLLNGLIPNGNNDVVGGGWYIGTTVVLYLLFPLLVRMFTRAKKKAAVPVLIMILQLVIIISLYFITNDPEILENNTFTYFSFIR